MSIYLSRLARVCVARRRLVLALWVLALAVVTALAIAGRGKTIDNFTVPGTQAQHAADLLEQKVPALGGAQSQVVVASSTSAVTVGGPKAAIEQTVANLKRSPQVAAAFDPFRDGSVAADQRAVTIQVQFTVPQANVSNSSLNAMQRDVLPARAAGLQVQFGGQVYPGSALALSEAPEIIGIAIALLILLITFGALVAAGLPLLTALIGVVVGLMGVTAVSAVVNVASVATSLALMLGLSCGIDYALFIVSRHRASLLQGCSVEDSIALAAGTAGSSVVFAALTLILALCGLTVVGIPFLAVMGLCAAGAVLVALAVALTLLPALLGFAGQKLTSFISMPWLSGSPAKPARDAGSAPERTAGATWAKFVVRFRVALLLGGIGLLVFIALPAFDLQLGLPSGQGQPAGNTAHKAYELVSEHFGVGANGPLVVVAQLTDATTPHAEADVVSALRKQPDVVAVKLAATENNVAVITVVPRTGPNASATADLVHSIRSDEAALRRQTGAIVLVGGTTAANIDTSAKLSQALPVFLILIAGLALVLLTLAFRTILVPFTSVIGFLLSTFAAFGAEVAVFQWGWLRSLFGTTPSETISFVPIVLLAVLFGLSGDYEVFVVSRIKEEFARTGEGAGAVQRGTAVSVRVITAAALIMFAVFVAFLTDPDPIVKSLALSLAVGVFLDAFVVRLTLVPAVIAVVGERFWYHPQWFDRYVPDPDIEGAELQALHGAAAPIDSRLHLVDDPYGRRSDIHV